MESAIRYTFKERIIREFVKLTVEKAVSDINKTLHSRYDSMIYSEKIKYSNSKEYRKIKNKNNNNSDDEIFEQLGYWSAHNRCGASNVPHISSSSYEGRVFNGDLEGFIPSIIEKDYMNTEIQKLIDELTDNDMVQMIKSCLKNPVKWKETSKYDEFCSHNQNGCTTKIMKQLEELDAILNIQNTSHKSVGTQYGLKVYEDKIEADIFRKSYRRELDAVEDYCLIDVEILESGRKTQIIVYTNVYPLHKNILGLKKGDKFSFPNIAQTYQIQRIY